MFGKFTHNVDPKGRLFVPAKLREELGDVFYVMIGLDNSLLVFPEEKWEKATIANNFISLYYYSTVKPELSTNFRF